MAKDKDKIAEEDPQNSENSEQLPEEISEEVEIQGAGGESLEESLEVDPAEELRQARLELDEYKNLFLRKAAEFENFKKRKQLEFQALIKNASEAVILDLLPALDDFDRFLSVEQGDNESLLEGARLIREKLWEPLAARGLEPIQSLGAHFDPEIHEALLQQEVENTEPGIIVEEHQRGYKLGDRVIRPAKVVVSA